MTVRLERITADNWEEAIHLKVADEQRHFVAPNVYSIAEASFEPNYGIYAIYAGAEMVGFTMFGYEDDAEITGYAIARLMIDRRFQGRGYGRAALHLIIADLRGRPDCRCIYISFEPENETARHLYAAVGFVSEGRIIEGEVVYRLDV